MARRKRKDAGEPTKMERSSASEASDAPELEPVNEEPENEEPAETQPDGPEPLPRLDIDDVTFETLRGASRDTLGRLCRDNGLGPIGTQMDLMSRLRTYKIGRADRRNENICQACGGIGTRLRGPSTTSHVVSRPFKCTKCGQTFTARQDTRKGGA